MGSGKIRKWSGEKTLQAFVEHGPYPIVLSGATVETHRQDTCTVFAFLSHALRRPEFVWEYGLKLLGHTKMSVGCGFFLRNADECRVYNGNAPAGQVQRRPDGSPCEDGRHSEHRCVRSHVRIRTSETAPESLHLSACCVVAKLQW